MRNLIHFTTALLLIVWMPFASLGQGLIEKAIVVRSVIVHEGPSSSSPDLEHVAEDEEMALHVGAESGDYLKVTTKAGVTGYVYKSRVRLRHEKPSWMDTEDVPGAACTNCIRACSFNIKFLGNGTKDHEALTDLLFNYDLVMVQELVAPPYAGTYPDGSTYTSDDGSRPFFDMMKTSGFSYMLSEEDTGPTTNHVASSNSEWHVAFYRPNKLRVDSALCTYISTPLTNHPEFERVPYRFQFATVDGTLDFSIINVHLDKDANETSERLGELLAISQYASTVADSEKDFLIVGDMNIQDESEYKEVLPGGWVSLNDSCVTTNVAGSKNENNRKPYDHVMYRPTFTANDLDLVFDVQVVDIFEKYYDQWALENPNKAASSGWVASFAAKYSDHHPIVFRLKYGVGDDD